MTLILAKQCSDGIILVSDSVHIVVKNGGAPVIGSGDRKLITGTREGRNYGIIFAGQAKMDDLKPTKTWLEQAVRSPGSLRENIPGALLNTLTDAHKNADWTDDAERIDWESNEARCFSLHSNEPGILYYSEAVWGLPVRCIQVNYGRVIVLAPMETPAENDTLSQRCDHGTMPLNKGLRHLADLFDHVADSKPNGCRYPGHYWILRSSGIAIFGEFFSLPELRKIAAKI